MGDLPSCRLMPQKLFNSTGIDYEGPIKYNNVPQRSHKVCPVNRRSPGFQTQTHTRARAHAHMQAHTHTHTRLSGESNYHIALRTLA